MDSKNLFSWNKQTKIFLTCIGLSILVWVVQKLSGEHTLTVQVPIAYHVPESKTMAENPIQETQLIVRGIGWDLIKSKVSKQSTNINLVLSTDSIQEIHEYHIKDALSREKRLNKLQILDINPGTISIRLVQNFQKKVPIKLIEDISYFPDHHLVNPIRLEPDSVTLYGPKDILDTMSFWNTEPLTLQKVKNNIQKNLKLASSANDLLKFSTTSTIVSLEIEEFTEKIFELPITIERKKGEQLFGYRAIPEKARIYATLPLSKYDIPSDEEFKLVAEIEDLKSLNLNNKIKLQLKLFPSYIKSFKIHPNNVEIYLHQ